MFSNSLEEFINEHRSKLVEDKSKLFADINTPRSEKNDDEKVFISEANNQSEDCNEPQMSSSEEVINENDEKMLKYGEFSPNNPKMRVATQPFLGLGEYEQRRQLLLEQRKAEYQQYAEKVKRATEQDNAFIKNHFKGSRPVSNHHSRSSSLDKSSQTDIQNVNSQLVQLDPSPHQSLIEKQKSPRSRGRGVNIDKVQIQTQNNIIVPSYNKYLDKIGVKNNSPRAKLMADLQSSYFPTVMGYTPPTTDEDDRMDKVRRQEKYLTELRQQIEEKQRLLQKHKDQEKFQQDLETKRLESQIREMNIEDKQSLIVRQSYSSDIPVSSVNIKEYDNKSDQTCNRNKRVSDNKRYKSPNESKSYSNTKYTSKYSNSPPITKRDRPPYSFNIPPNSVFAKALPVSKDKIDNKNSKLALNINSNYTTKEKQSRGTYANTNKLEESLPIPVLKAQSPVAKELINALPVQSKTSDAMRKLEDKWQIPAVQKNIIKTAERPSEGNNQGILTQLGAIRLQLQQEQLRLDETLRKRGTSQNVQVDIHNNLI